jgi:excisionase family DNA binding protein
MTASADSLLPPNALDRLLDDLADRVADRLAPLLALAGSTADAWLDTRAAAEHLGVHRDTLRKLAAAGAIASEQDGPTCRRYFKTSELDRWRESGGRFHAASIPRKNGR